MPFNVGPVELIIVLVIALLVIGPRRLPEMGNAVGKTIREFRKASTDINEAATLEPEAKPTPAASTPPAPVAESEPAPEAASAVPASTAPASVTPANTTEPAQPTDAAPAAAEPKSDDA